jgi:serine/threonine protein kinase
MTGPLESVAIALSGRYAVEREIARGGMATVYLAQDIERRRAVAVKVMDSRLAGGLDHQRFVREIELASSLSHPHIVPLYDSGDAGGVLFYVMPYIEGESLFERLQRERQLPLEDALRIARDVAGALGYAHGSGVLHRDVKPENILLSGTRALVTDFGLARAIGEANYRRLTETGVIVGSAFYMSPEQIREDRGLDQRTDIYSLGCILYEMLTGEPPYTAPSIMQLIKRIITAPVPSARRLRDTVPPQVDEAVSRALAKTARERFATMEEFAAALIVEPALPQPAPAPPAEPAPPPPRTPLRGLGGLFTAIRSLISRDRSAS